MKGRISLVLGEMLLTSRKRLEVLSNIITTSVAMKDWKMLSYTTSIMGSVVK